MKIIQKDLPQSKNIKFIISLEKQAVAAFKYVSASMTKEIIAGLRAERLIKSLPKGWTGEVNKVAPDLGEIISPVIKKHMDALRWLLYGDMAGKDAKAAAKAIGLKGKSIAGLLPSAYLQSIDAQRDYYSVLNGVAAPEMGKGMIFGSLKEILARTRKFIDEFTLKTTNSVIESVQVQIDQHNYDNLSDSMEAAHEGLGEGMSGRDAVSRATEGAGLGSVNTDAVVSAIEGAMTKAEGGWEFLSKNNIGTSSAVGTHQAMVEIFGAKSDDIKAVLITSEDERLCDSCDKFSKNSDGSFIYYSLSDFKPSGYNYGKKKKDWDLTVPPVHINCRCSIVHVPPGMTVLPNGTITSIRKA